MKLSPIGNDAPFVDSNGNPLSGGLLYAYSAGSSTPLNTYTTSAGTVANANPIVLDSAGYPASGGSVVEIWLTSGSTYKFVLKTSAGVTLWTRDNISGINDTSVTIDQWVSGPTPTYVSATQFTLVGDQTSTFHVGRRLKTTNSGGTVYSRISVSAFGALTTITVVNDSGTLDSGLSAVNYGLISADNTSTPAILATVINAAGDTIYGTGADAYTRLALGTARQVLAVNAGATAPAWSDKITLATEQATTSGTSIDFTGIPAGVRRINIMPVGVSSNGTSNLLIQLGDAGGFENTGYTSFASNLSGGTSSTAGFIVTQSVSAATDVKNGIITLLLENAAAFTWVQSGNIIITPGSPGIQMSAGSKSLSAELTQIRITHVNGTDTFDAGVINISYE